MNRIDETELPQQYRLVFETATDAVASIATTDRPEVMARFDAMVTVFAAEIAAGELRIRVLRDDVWAERGGR